MATADMTFPFIQDYMREHKIFDLPEIGFCKAEVVGDPETGMMTIGLRQVQLVIDFVIDKDGNITEPPNGSVETEKAA